MIEQKISQNVITVQKTAFWQNNGWWNSTTITWSTVQYENWPCYVKGVLDLKPTRQKQTRSSAHALPQKHAGLLQKGLRWGGNVWGQQIQRRKYRVTRWTGQRKVDRMENCRSSKKLLDYEPTYLDLPNFHWEGLGKDKAILRSLGEGP